MGKEFYQHLDATNSYMCKQCKIHFLQKHKLCLKLSQVSMAEMF